MAVITKPLLACDLKGQWDKLTWPQYGTQKLDGIRALCLSGKGLVSRTFKPIANLDIRSTLEAILPKDCDCDGELIAGNFQETTHRVMNVDEKTPGYKYYMFDLVSELDTPYVTRMENMKLWYETLAPEHKELIHLVLPVKLNNKAEVEAFEQKCLDEDFEGVILRLGDSIYKCGRSTLNQQILTKVKRFSDSEATILGFEELERNHNVAKKNVFGRTERSLIKANMVGGNTLGTLLVKDINSGIEVRVGSGLDDTMRMEIWSNQEKYLNQIIKYKYFSVGVKDKPRHPVFQGFRHLDDMGE